MFVCQKEIGMDIDEKVSPQEWDRFVETQPAGHVLQTAAWGTFKAGFGWQAERLALREGDRRSAGRIIAGAQVLFRRLPLGWTVAYVPKGPLVDFADVETCRHLFSALHRLCRARRAIMLKIEPEREEDAPLAGPLAGPLAAQLAAHGFRRGQQTIQPRRTIWVDLTATEDEILGQMKSKTRYNIRLAGRKEVEVHAGGSQDLAAFVQLMTVTGARNEFGIHHAGYYQRAYDLFVPRDMARLFMATYQGQTLAGIMVFAFGNKAWYMYGASGNEHREKMPTYALQWAAIRWAKSRGCEIYDLWGVPDEDQETLEAQFMERREGLWGVYRFKRGFGGRLVRYAGAFDHVYNKPLYRLYHLFLKIFR